MGEVVSGCCGLPCTVVAAATGATAAGAGHFELACRGCRRTVARTADRTFRRMHPVGAGFDVVGGGP